MGDAPPAANRMCSAPVRPIQIPISIGAMKTGVDRGAAAIDDALRGRLSERGRGWIIERLCESAVVDVERLETPDTRRYPGQALELDAVARASETLGGYVSESISRGELALTVGGDHAASIGSIAAASITAERLAVIWIDAHADMNWPDVSPSGRMHGMSLGASLGRGAPEVTGLLGKSPKLYPRDTYLLGIRLLDPGEEAWLGEDEFHVVTMPDVDSLGVDAAVLAIIASIQRSEADAVHVSFDVDALDPLTLSGTGTPERGGFTFREAGRILRLLRHSDLPIRSIDWVELNPDLDPTGNSTAVAADLLAVALGEDVFVSGRSRDCAG